MSREIQKTVEKSKFNPLANQPRTLLREEGIAFKSFDLKLKGEKIGSALFFKTTRQEVTTDIQIVDRHALLLQMDGSPLLIRSYVTCQYGPLTLLAIFGYSLTPGFKQPLAPLFYQVTNPNKSISDSFFMSLSAMGADLMQVELNKQCKNKNSALSLISSQYFPELEALDQSFKDDFEALRSPIISLGLTVLEEQKSEQAQALKDLEEEEKAAVKKKVE